MHRHRSCREAAGGEYPVRSLGWTFFLWGGSAAMLLLTTLCDCALQRQNLVSLRILTFLFKSIGSRKESRSECARKNALITRAGLWRAILRFETGFKSELFAMGPVQFSWPRGVAENSFTKRGFWEHFVDFSQEKQQNTEFTKFSLVRTPEVY